MENSEIHILELTVCSSIPLYIMKAGRITGIGTGLILIYKQRYFLITAEHNIKANHNYIAIPVGPPNSERQEIVSIHDFSFLASMELSKINGEAIQLAIENFEGTRALDVAIAEIKLLDNIVQMPISIPLEDETLHIPYGGKSMVKGEKNYVLNRNSLFSFAGMIKSKTSKGPRPQIEPQLKAGLTVSGVSQYFIEFNLGHPITEHRLYKGCSGAPIFDLEGNLAAILTGGSSNVNSPFVYGFRFDVIRNFIDMLYFNPALDWGIANAPNKKANMQNQIGS